MNCPGCARDIVCFAHPTAELNHVGPDPMGLDFHAIGCGGCVEAGASAMGAIIHSCDDEHNWTAAPAEVDG